MNLSLLKEIVSISIRNLARHWRRTALAVLIISMGLGAYIFFGSFMRAMMDDMMENSVRATLGHARLVAGSFDDTGKLSGLLPQNTAPDAVISHPEIVSANARLVLPGMASSARGSRGVSVYGSELQREAETGQWSLKLTAGSLDTIDGERSAVIGQGLADKLQLKLGRRLVLFVPSAGGETAAVTVRVRAIAEFGTPDLDDGAVWMHLPLLQETAGTGDTISEIQILLSKRDRADAWVADLKPGLDDSDWRLLSWGDANPMMKQMTGQIDVGMQIYLIVIVIAVVVGILDTLLITVYERFYEFGILRSIGFTRVRLAIMILVESLLTGIIGTMVGAGIGAASSLIVHEIGIDLSAFSDGLKLWGMTPIVRPDLHMMDIIDGARTVIISVGIVSLYPMTKAIRRPPLELLRERGL